MNNETANFELVDENRVVVLEFGIEDIKFVDEDIDSYDVFPSENVDVLFSIDESKGGMFSYEIESDVVPTIEDFNYSQTTIDTPEGYWDIIDNIFFKGGKLEVYDYLDGVGKSSDVFIFVDGPIQ